MAPLTLIQHSDCCYRKALPGSSGAAPDAPIELAWPWVPQRLEHAVAGVVNVLDDALGRSCTPSLMCLLERRKLTILDALCRMHRSLQ